jgi:hypothetical protein
MTDLHQDRDVAHRAKIDAIGWLFAAFVVTIISIGALVAYHGNNASVTTTVVRAAAPAG